MLEALIPAVASLAGGFFSSQANQDMAAQNIAWQQRFAKNAIQWKVADANKAGVHPLFALGAPTTSFAPVNAGDTSPLQGLAAAGQHLGRALAPQQTQTERIGQIGVEMQNTQLENAKLQNLLLASQIRRINQPATPPALPSPGGNFMPGQGDTPALITVKPGTTETSSPGTPSQAAVIAPDVAYSETPTGLAPIPSKTVKEQIEDITIPQLMWGIRNNVIPQLGFSYNPPARPAGEGKVWIMHPILGEWQAVDKDSYWAKFLMPTRAVGGTN